MGLAVDVGGTSDIRRCFELGVRMVMVKKVYFLYSGAGVQVRYSPVGIIKWVHLSVLPFFTQEVVAESFLSFFFVF